MAQMNILGKWIRRLIAPAGLFCWFAAAAHADLVTFQFTGVVTQVPIDDLYGDISFGNAITGSYSFNSLAADGAPADATTGSYTSLGIPYVFNASFAGHVFSVTDYLNIGVFNSVVDQYTVFALNPTLTLEIFLQDNSGAVFGNDQLPLFPPPLGSFVLRDFHFDQVLDGETQVDGRIDSLTCSSGCTANVVPEPSGLIPICAILAGLGVGIRHRRAAGRVFSQFN
jgi:hypothetical protein